ncbi:MULTISPECIES: hypothetical protein, partial [unclassified Pseudomonas]
AVVKYTPPSDNQLHWQLMHPISPETPHSTDRLGDTINTMNRTNNIISPDETGRITASVSPIE